MFFAQIIADFSTWIFTLETNGSECNMFNEIVTARECVAARVRWNSRPQGPEIIRSSYWAERANFLRFFNIYNQPLQKYCVWYFSHSEKAINCTGYFVDCYWLRIYFLYCLYCMQRQILLIKCIPLENVYHYMYH